MKSCHVCGEGMPRKTVSELIVLGWAHTQGKLNAEAWSHYFCPKHSDAKTIVESMPRLKP